MTHSLFALTAALLATAHAQSPAAQAAVNRQLVRLTGQKLDPRVLQRAFSRTRFTTNLDLNALNEYAELNVEAGYARSVPDLRAFLKK